MVGEDAARVGTGTGALREVNGNGKRNHSNTGVTGGRPRSNPTWNYFSVDEAAKRATCLVQGCIEVLQAKNGVSNLMRHMKRNHPKMHEKILEEMKIAEQQQQEKPVLKKPKKNPVLNGVQHSMSTIKNCLVQLVTENGRPFSIVDDSGIQGLIQPLLAAAPEEERQAVTSRTIREEVSSKGDATREKLIEELKGKLLSLKVDGVSRKGKSYLGINAQFIENGKIHLRTLAVKVLTVSHTGLNMSLTIQEVLADYKIHVDQIYSITVDNGTNMVKAAEWLAEEQTGSQGAVVLEDSDAEDPDEEDEDDEDADDDVNSEFDDTEVYEEPADLDAAAEEDLVNGLQDDGLDLPALVLTCIRCAALTLHLAVGDTVKQAEIKDIIVKMRAMCKKLRTPRMLRLLKIYQLKPPVLDCETRWSSCVTMLESMLPLQAFALEHLKEKAKKRINKTRSPRRKKKIVEVKAEFFEKTEKIVEALLPARSTMTNLQGEQLTMGDFFGSWLRCKLKAKKLSEENPIAAELLENMENRESKLFDNVAFSSAIYMDPRFFEMLPLRAISQAESHLQKVWVATEKLKSNEEETAVANESLQEEDVDADDDELEGLLKEVEEARGGPTGSVRGQRSIIPLLKQFRCTTPRLKPNEDVLEFWEKRKKSSPELYSIASVVLAAPATQVSVERLFSGVKYVMSDLRMKMASTLVDDIMVIRTNAIFTKKSQKSKSASGSPLKPSNKENASPNPSSRPSSSNGTATPSRSSSLSSSPRISDPQSVYDFHAESP